MRLLLLLIVTLLTMLAGTATAEGDATEDLAPFSASYLSGVVVSCSTKLPSLLTGCFLEKRVLTFGGFEASLALDVQAALRGIGESYLAPMLSLAYYAPSWSAWLEVALPAGVVPIPAVGRSDAMRLGFTYTIP